MKNIILNTVDNYSQTNKYAKILSLSNKYGGMVFAINNWSAIIDVYYVGSYGTYGTHVKFAISWQSLHELKIVQLTEDVEHKIQDNVLAYVPTDEGLDLYVASLYNVQLALKTRVKVTAFSDNGVWIDNAKFVDISNLSPVYYTPTRKVEVKSSTLNKTYTDTFMYKRGFTTTNSTEIDLSPLGDSNGTFFVEFRSYSTYNVPNKIRGIDIICNNGNISTRSPYPLNEGETLINASFDSTNNKLTVSGYDTQSFIFYKATRL